jgi:hypothetical protein
MDAEPPTVESWLANIFPSGGTEFPLYKRGPYQHHKDNRLALEPIFRALSGYIPDGGLSRLAGRVGLKVTTLSCWKRMLARDPTWRPSRDAYALPHRIFTDAQEARLLGRIFCEYLYKGFFYCDEDFKIDALKFHQEIFNDLEERASYSQNDFEALAKMRDFKASDSFVHDFRARHRMALRRPSMKRRRRVTEEEMEAFIHRAQELMRGVPAERIVNLDETNWRSVAPGFLTWATRGAESVPCIIDNDEKEGITVIAAIDAAGSKLPLTIIGKGKTPRCLAALNLRAAVWTATSISGWTNSEVMCRYFELLRVHLDPDGPLVLVLDTYSAHRAEAVRAAAAIWNIELLFIPPGCTDRLQPLDRKVFGVLKGYARQLWRQQYHDSHGGKTTRAKMASNLIEAWDRIAPHVIESAWSIDTNDWGVNSSEDDEEDLADREYHLEITVEGLLDFA